MAALTLKLQPHRQPALEELKPVTSTRYLKFLITNTQLFNLTEPACRMGLSVRFFPLLPLTELLNCVLISDANYKYQHHQMQISTTVMLFSDWFRSLQRPVKQSLTSCVKTHYCVSRKDRQAFFKQCQAHPEEESDNHHIPAAGSEGLKQITQSVQVSSAHNACAHSDVKETLRRLFMSFWNERVCASGRAWRAAVEGSRCNK